LIFTGKVGLLIATWEFELNPVPVMVAVNVVPAVQDAGDMLAMVTGCTSVRDVEAVIAGLPTLATIPTVVMLELPNDTDDHIGALYVAVVFPVDVMIGLGGVQLTTAFTGALVKSAAKYDVDVPSANSTFGLGFDTEIDGTSKSIVTC
jgi:hypothetical protein